MKNGSKKLETKREIYEFIDSASPENIGKLREEIGHLAETEEEKA